MGSAWHTDRGILMPHERGRTCHVVGLWGGWRSRALDGSPIAKSSLDQATMCGHQHDGSLPGLRGCAAAKDDSHHQSDTKTFVHL